MPLALSIREALGQVDGVTGQEIEVIGYINAEELNAMLRELADRTTLHTPTNLMSERKKNYG